MELDQASDTSMTINGQEIAASAKRLPKYLGMLNRASPLPPETQFLLRSSIWVRARYSGIFRSNVRTGDAVRSNQVVGFITDPTGDFKVPVKAATSGHVIELSIHPIPHQGLPSCILALFNLSKKMHVRYWMGLHRGRECREFKNMCIRQ